MRKMIMMLMLGGLFSGTALALDDVITVKLDAQNNSGQTGTATLTPQGNTTRVVIELLNAPTDVAQPAHIHLGACDKLDKAPKWPLEPLKGGRSTTTVPVSLDTILKDKTAINVHKSAAEVQAYVACGNIVGLM